MRSLAATASFPFTAHLSEAALRALRELPVRRVTAETQVLRRGDQVDGMFLVTSGALRVYHLTADGREVTLYRVEPGQTCILALTAAFRSDPYPAWVEAGRDDVRFVLVPRSLLREMIGAEPALREFVFEALSARVFELMERLAEASVMRVESRVAALLLRRSDASGVVLTTQARIASELGTAREVVSRTLRSLEAEGLIATSRGRVLLRDRERLAQRAAV